MSLAAATGSIELVSNDITKNLAIAHPIQINSSYNTAIPKPPARKPNFVKPLPSTLAWPTGGVCA
jgi:hypothetical protein